MQYRRPRRKSKYWVEPEIFDSVVTYCRCYPLWVKELQTLPDTSKAIVYDKDRVQTSGDYDATAETAMRREELARKVKLIEDTASEAAPEMRAWLIRGVTDKGVTLNDLLAQGMPWNKNVYAKARAYFYYLMSRRI